MTLFKTSFRFLYTLYTFSFLFITENMPKLRIFSGIIIIIIVVLIFIRFSISQYIILQEKQFKG